MWGILCCYNEGKFSFAKPKMRFNKSELKVLIFYKKRKKSFYKKILGLLIFLNFSLYSAIQWSKMMNITKLLDLFYLAEKNHAGRNWFGKITHHSRSILL
jgi:hypothetical protein